MDYKVLQRQVLATDPLNKVKCIASLMILLYMVSNKKSI